MTEFIYDAPRGMRTHRNFESVTAMGDMWWCNDLGRWVKAGDKASKGKATSSHHKAWEGAPRTLKALKSYIKRHPELAGETLVFVNRYYIKREGKPDVYRHITVNL